MRIISPCSSPRNASSPSGFHHMSQTLLQLCPAADVPEGGALKVELDGLILAVFHLGERYYVTDDTCTHGPGSLSEGEIDGEIVECNFHQGCFHIPTGRVEAPPCMIPLKTYNVQVVDGKVFIEAPAPGQ